jgi:hypothetical protein
MEMHNIKSVFEDLKVAINNFYTKHSDLDADGTIDMSQILRNCSKMECLLNNEFYQLWLLEQEDRRRLQKQLESIPVETVRLRSDSIDSSMPGLVPIGRPIESASSMPGLGPITSEVVWPHPNSIDSVPGMPIRGFATPVPKVVLNPEDDDDLHDSENQVCKIDTPSNLSEIVHETSLPNEVQSDIFQESLRHNQMQVPIPRNGIFSTFLTWPNTHILQ